MADEQKAVEGGGSAQAGGVSVPINATQGSPVDSKKEDITPTSPSPAQPPIAAERSAPVTPPVSPAPKPDSDTTFINPGSAFAKEQATGVSTEKPITVSEAEIESSTTNSEHLESQIETLSGEIQALESNIDRLTSGITSVETKKPEIAVAENAKPVTPPPPPIVTTEQLKTAEKPQNKPAVIDIYARTAQLQKEQENREEKSSEFDDVEEVGRFSGLGTIGEVLVVFGVIIFLLLIAIPFIKSSIPANIWDALKSIGWPTVGITMLLGLILTLLNKGKGMMKILTVVFLLVTVLMYLGITGHSSFLGPLSGFVDSISSFYK